VSRSPEVNPLKSSLQWGRISALQYINFPHVSLFYTFSLLGRWRDGGSSRANSSLTERLATPAQMRTDSVGESEIVKFRIRTSFQRLYSEVSIRTSQWERTFFGAHSKIRPLITEPDPNVLISKPSGSRAQDTKRCVYYATSRVPYLTCS
jgi:hypothetical protein